MNTVVNALILLLSAFVIGGLPLTGWMTRRLSGQQLAQVGTGNVGISAAFYHGGTLAGILAVLAEAGKGIGMVLLARTLFPQEAAWELLALIALVAGRFWLGKGAGTTNVVWGCIAYSWAVALFIFLIGGISFTILRQRQQGRLAILLLLPLIIALYRQDVAETLAAMVLSTLLGWIYRQIPDDLDLATPPPTSGSQPVFQFFRGNRAVLSLDQRLDPRRVGQKAATLSQLKRWGYPVPPGWVLPAGDDPEPLIESLYPTENKPLIVRSSAVGEDTETASAAGQYRSIAWITSRSALMDAIAECQSFYDHPSAAQYRQDRKVPEASMAVLVQEQVQGVFSGVAFSRDPVGDGLDAVAIEALPGEASRVVSGQITPERYRILVPSIPEAEWEIEGEPGDLPPQLLREVARLAREVEARYHGVPQDIEWSYDGRTLWLLQARPVTTLLPIWTRKIAAEVLPGVIRPLTWSINQPLTCGVWGSLFTVVLGRRVRGLDFNQTATLHYSRAYFNASLLGQIFRLMGLPPESLEFLTRGASMTRPSLGATLRNTPGLLRLVGRELTLARDFERDYRRVFVPTLRELTYRSPTQLSPPELKNRIHQLLQVLRRVTYYSILAPLSAALRQALLRVPDEALDTSQTPEAASLRSLQAIARASRHLVDLQPLPQQSTDLFATLAASPDGAAVLAQLDRFLERYGYLSEVGTDIAVPTWREDPRPVRELFASLLLNPPPERQPPVAHSSWKARWVQQRVNLKGRVAAIYSQFLAELRWSFLALEQAWLQAGLLTAPGDIFFLEFAEVRQILDNTSPALLEHLTALIAERRSRFEQDCRLETVPTVVYGKAPRPTSLSLNPWTPSQLLQGIGASPGRVEGQVKVLQTLQAIPEIDGQTILVVPYTDAGWAPLLSRAGGLISEVGGRLSHGAIVAREYQIPAVMDIPHATQRLRDGQWVRIDGQRGIVEIL